MAAHPKPRLTPEEYLEIERAAEIRHEYFNGEMFAMAGGMPQHAQIIANLTGELRSDLKGQGCFVMPQDVRTSISHDGLYTYPDVVIVCGNMKFTDGRRDTITNPSVIIEVLSPSTEAYDRGFKSTQYRQIESLREYALVSQVEAHVEVYRRQPGGHWLLTEFFGLEAVCQFESLGCGVKMSEIYYLVQFGSEDGPFAGRTESA